MLYEKRKIAIFYSSLNRLYNPFLPSFMYLPPIGIIYIDELLKKNGFSVIKSEQCKLTTTKEIKSFYSKYKPEIILFNQYYSTRKAVKAIIDKLPRECIIGIGGHDVTFHSGVLNGDQLVKQYENVDFIWQGEAENSLNDFLENVNSGASLELINNLTNRIQDTGCHSNTQTRWLSGRHGIPGYFERMHEKRMRLLHDAEILSGRMEIKKHQSYQG